MARGVFRGAAYIDGMTKTSTAVPTVVPRELDGKYRAYKNSGPEVEELSVAQIEADIERREAAAAERQMFAEVLDGVEAASYFYASRRGQMNDVDDIIGDTLVDVIAQQKRGTTHINDGAFKQAAAGAVSSRYVDKEAHHTDLKGRRIFNAKVEELMQVLGRELNTRERRLLADEIRMSFPAGRRPSIGFEHKNVAVSLDMQVGEDGGTTLGDLIAADESGSGYATATSKAAAANEALEQGGSFKAADARKNIWNILADNGPQVAVMSIHDDRELRAVVEEFGGPVAVARAWQQGDTAEDDPVNEALFAPFGKLDEQGKERVTSILLRNATYAEKVWDAAMSAALDNQKKRNKMRAESRAAARKKAA